MRAEQAASPGVSPFVIDRARLKAVLDRSRQARERSQELLAKTRAARSEGQTCAMRLMTTSTDEGQVRTEDDRIGSQSG